MFFQIIIFSFGNLVDRSDLIGDRSYGEVSPNRSADELLPRRGPRERRASVIGEHVGIPASNEHLSKGAGDVSGGAPPMLKSAVYENKTRRYAVCKKNHDPCINASPPLIKSSSNGPDGGVLSSDAMFLTSEMTVAPIEMTVELPKMIWIVEGHAIGRFFFVKCDVMRDPWKCEMHWRDSAVTLTPGTPDRAPSLTPFLEAMHGKSYSAPELIKEDLLCFYKFSRKGVELVGDLDERMGKAELLRAMQEAAAAPPPKSTKRKASPTGEKEARGERRKKAGASTSVARTEEPSKPKQAPTPPTPSSEEALDVPPVTATVGGPSSGKRLEQPPPFDPSKDSLIESPCPVAATRYICNMAPDRDVRVLRKARNADVVGHFSSHAAADSLIESPCPVAATRYICNMAPDRDVRVLRKARNADVVGHFSSHAAAVVAWGGEMVKRLTKAHQKMNASRDQFDKAMGQHAEVLARLEELETLRSREQEAAAAQREALEAKLVTEREAHEAEKAAREMLEAELEDVKSRAARDAERLKLEGREEFLKSSEFDTLLGKKAGGFFKTGFLGCVAQWRANGYSEDEHPAPFLNVQQAIAEMPDEEDAQEEGEDEEKGEGAIGSEATPPSSPLS
ncbi:hypothetical protein F511_16757 [Dorcoceras hygrometricum]|uniref:Uncharacterized protein n=1 Tax=Dorcoceras hygrometricum TaxID=472368 RepID=A0A2Z7ANI5_9LAMI|nr:hypothetical protein F511_16757 [Dorcoceras hygrometricum]